MGAIIDFFESLISIIGSVVDFVIGLVQDLIYVVQLLGEALAEMPVLFGWLPAEVLVVLLTVFALLVVLRILGRDG